MFFVLSQAWDKEKIMNLVSEVFHEEVYYEVLSLIPYGDSKFFLCPTILTSFSGWMEV